MKLLALDTSTEACSAAILYNEEITEEYRIAPRLHSELILSMVERVLAEAGLLMQDLDAVAFGQGPGSFVGVRIATGVVQGLAYSAGLGVLPVSSLAAMAQGYKAADNLLVAIDARMQEVYWAEYRRNSRGLVELIGEESVQAPACVSYSEQAETLSASIYHGIGTGWGTYIDDLSARCGVGKIQSEVFPHAKDILPLAARDFQAGGAINPLEAKPVYLRNQVVQKRLKVKG